MTKFRTQFAMLMLVVVPSALADIVVPGADGSDGDLIVSSNLTIDLRKAWAGDDKKGVPWDTPGGDRDGDNLGDGVYDPEKWAVVFKWNKVEIKSGATVTFINHYANPPVVWLVAGEVLNNGSINLNGANGHPGQGKIYFAEPGPGGFRGGRGSSKDTVGTGGFGPGGAKVEKRNSYGSGAGHASEGGRGYNGGEPGLAYSSPFAVPLFGGSGGNGMNYDGDHIYDGGGAGGGAILIAAQQRIAHNGTIAVRGGANGGAYGGQGSGGAIRLVTDRIAGVASFDARGSAPTQYTGGAADGRIRIEANDFKDLSGMSQPPYREGLPGDTAKLWPQDVGSPAPVLQVVKLGDRDVPSDPRSDITFPNADVALSNSGPTKVRIAAENVPTSWSVIVRAIPKTGFDIIASAKLVDGDDAKSVWEAEVQLPDGFTVIQVRAAKK